MTEALMCRFAAIGLVACLVAMGCDSVHYVQRTVSVGQLPTQAEVEAALHELPDIQEVTVRQVTPAEEWVPGQGTTAPDPPYYQISYRSATAHGTVEVKQTRQGTKEVTLSCAWMNKNPSHQEVAAARSLMDKVYVKLQERVPGLPPGKKVPEKVLGIPGE
jgi:hypothetical protein